MKKIVSVISILVIMLVFRNEVYAADLEAEDTLGEVTYDFDVITFDVVMNSPSGHAKAYKSNGTITFKGYKLCAYKETGITTSVKFFVYNGYGYYNCGSFFNNVKKYVSSSVGAYEYGMLNIKTGEFNDDYSNYYTKGSSLAFMSYWGEYDYADSDNCGKFETNVPIFASEKQALAFINGEITEKEALNFESDLCDIVYDLEVPQNLEVSYTSNLFDASTYDFKWTQNDSNYVNWKTEFYVYADVGGYDGVLGIQLGDEYVYENEFIYSEKIECYRLRYSIDEDTDIYNKGFEKVWTKIIYEKLKNTAVYVNTYKVYMRNAFFDGTMQHYSNWLYVEVDYEFSDGIGDVTVVEKGGSIGDTPGTTTSDKDVVGSVVTDSNYDGSVDANLGGSNNDLLSWIKNGFGLGGENGVISLLRDTFSFVPGELWAVF